MSRKNKSSNEHHTTKKGKDKPTYKIIVLGCGGVGKSAITIQFVKSFFFSDYDPTIEDSYVKQCLIDNQIAQLEILDSAGQEEFKPMREQYMRVGEGFLLVFSLTDRHSLEECYKLHRDIIRIKDSDHVPMLLIGNKLDIRQTDLDIQARNAAIAMRIPYYETSARTRYNIDEVFMELMRENLNEQLEVLRAIFCRTNELVYDDLTERITYNAFDDQLQCVGFSVSVYTNDMIIVDSNVLSNDELKQFRAKTCGVATTTTTLYDLFSTLKDSYEQLIIQRAKQDSRVKECLKSTLMSIDHMRSPNVYMKRLHQWADQLLLTGRVLVIPHHIFILIEGTNEDIKQFIVKLRTETVDIDSRGRPCKERLLTQLAEICTDSSKFSNFERIEFETRQELLLYLTKHEYEQLHDHIAS
ncbi:unnamed protein product [Adineta ricciae]|uniref:Uncharacterized protein n=1 Tax=Adineta ricciae TaxID=249248 RepID=A0A814F9Z7_ADIRI|nr:unnamed protein product [Adineta ricciae]